MNEMRALRFRFRRPACISKYVFVDIFFSKAT